jgi:hypothetical protein
MMHGAYEIKSIRYFFLNNRKNSTLLIISGLLAKEASFSVSTLLIALHNETFITVSVYLPPVMSLNVTDDPEPLNKHNRKQNARRDNS